MPDKKTKICFVSVFAYPLFNPEFKGAIGGGGAELQMSLIAKGLAAKPDFDVNFVVLDWGQVKQEVISGVKLWPAYRRGRGLLNLLKAPTQLVSTLLKINPDVVVCRAAGVEAGLCGIYAQMTGKKFVYSVAHDDDLSGRFFRGLRGKLFKYGFFHANAIVAQTEDQLAAIEKMSFQKKPQVSLIKNSFPLDKIVGNENKDSILWVGRGAADKRPEFFLRLAKDFPQEKFVMIMPRAEEAVWASVSFALKNIPNLEFKERLPLAEVEKYFARAKVFVNTSSSEGFPNTFLQAMAANVPILSLSVDPDGFLTKYQAGLVAADDYAVLAANLGRLLSENALGTELSAKAAIYMYEQHNIEKNLEKWENVLSV